MRVRWTQSRCSHYNFENHLKITIQILTFETDEIPHTNSYSWNFPYKILYLKQLKLTFLYLKQLILSIQILTFEIVETFHTNSYI